MISQTQEFGKAMRSLFADPVTFVALYVGVLYTQPRWYSFSSWLHSDITSLGHSATCTFMGSPSFYSGDVFGLGYKFFLRIYM